MAYQTKDRELVDDAPIKETLTARTRNSISKFIQKAGARFTVAFAERASRVTCCTFSAAQCGMPRSSVRLGGLRFADSSKLFRWCEGPLKHCQNSPWANGTAQIHSRSTPGPARVRHNGTSSFGTKLCQMLVAFAILWISPALAHTGDHDKVVFTIREEKIQLVRPDSDGVEISYRVFWTGIIVLDNKTINDKKCKWSISARIRREVFEEGPLDAQEKFNDLSFEEIFPIDEVKLRGELLREIATSYAPRVEAYTRFGSEEGPCHNETTYERVSANEDDAQRAIMDIFDRAVRSDRILVTYELETIEPGPASQAFVGTRIVQEEVTLFLRGGVHLGNLDENLVAVYTALHEQDMLRTRKIGLDPDLILSDNLKRARVLFSQYPLSFDPLLRRLNKDNDNVELVEPLIPGVPFRWRGYTGLFVPDVALEYDNYTKEIVLDGVPLERVAQGRELLRYSYDRDTNGIVPLSALQDKIEKLRELNPHLAGVPDPASWTKGTVRFPADGIRIKVPIEFVENLGGFNEFLYRLELSPITVFVSGGGIKTQADGSDHGIVHAYSCEDPQQDKFRKHLEEINFLPPSVKLPDEMGNLRVFILDTFGKKEQTAGEKEQTATNKSIYRKILKMIANENRTIDEGEQEGLDDIARKLKLSKTTQKQIEGVKTEEFEEDYSVEIWNHPDFMNKFGGVAASVPGSPEELTEMKDRNKDHGYHVSSIIAALCNGYGVSGLAAGIKIIAFNVKLDLPSPGGNAVDSYKALKDIVNSTSCGENNVCIVNASWTIEGNIIGDLLKSAGRRVLMIAAAGNNLVAQGEGGEVCDLNYNRSIIFPACLGDRPNVLVVTSGRFIDDNKPPQKVSSGNFSKKFVAIAAPGFKISGSGLEKPMWASGTSQATAFVTAVAVLLQGKVPTLNAQEIKERILYTANLDVMTDHVRYGWLNAALALHDPDKDVIFYRGNYTTYQLKPDWEYEYLNIKHPHIDKIRLASIRRISKHQKNESYTIVFRDSEGWDQDAKCELSVVSGVSFEVPEGWQGNYQEFIQTRFKNTTGDREYINLDKVDELVIKAGIGSNNAPENRCW